MLCFISTARHLREPSGVLPSQPDRRLESMRPRTHVYRKMKQRYLVPSIAYPAARSEGAKDDLPRFHSRAVESSEPSISVSSADELV